jgi:hypothetical protein
MSDQLFLDMTTAIKIQMQIDACGLDVVVPQAILDLCDVFAPIEQIHGTGVAKAVSRMDGLEPFRRQCLDEILFADAIDAVAGEFLPPLIDKEAFPTEGLWADAIFADIELEEVRCLALKLYESETVSFTQDSQGFLFGVEVIEFEGADFAGSGP